MKLGLLAYGNNSPRKLSELFGRKPISKIKAKAILDRFNKNAEAMRKWAHSPEFREAQNNFYVK